MKYFSGILLASIMAIGTVSADLASSLFDLEAYVLVRGAKSWDIYEGLVLGLQQNPNNTAHQCFQSFELLKDNIQKMPDYLTAISNTSSAENSIVTTLTNNPWYQPNTYFKLLKRGQEIGTLFFTLYDKCYLDDLLIAVGRTVNSFSGGFNTMTTLAVYLFNLLNLDDPTNDITNMLTISKWGNTASGVTPVINDDTKSTEVGKVLGKIFTKIFNVQVPDVQYNVYN